MSISDHTRRILWGRSGGICARCGRRLIVDANDRDREALVGQECHIISAKPKGPRHGAPPPGGYDGIANLLLLCSVCHDVVDRQPWSFSAEALREIKSGREAQIAQRLTSGHFACVPVRTLNFVGRKRYLARIANCLDRHGAVALHGIGGVGKSVLAAHFARTEQARYDIVWWARAERPETLRRDLAELAIKLGVVPTSQIEESVAERAALDWLQVNGRWLLIFDDAVSPAGVADWIPRSVLGHVLITSRAHADWQALGAQPVAVHVWHGAESREFLTKRTGERDEMTLDTLADTLGDLPLALEQAAAYINSMGLTVSNYLERMRGDASELAGRGRPLGYPHTVATVWSLAFAQAAEDRVARGLLDACAYFAPDAIPRDLIEMYRAADVTGQRLDDAIGRLLGYALLTDAADATVSMHRLLQAHARHRMSAGDRKRALYRAATLLAERFPSAPQRPECWPACERLLAHVLRVAEHASVVAVPDTLPPLLVQLGRYLGARAELSLAISTTEQAVGFIEDSRGRDHWMLAGPLVQLGMLQRQRGDSQAAIATLERALRIDARARLMREEPGSETEGYDGPVVVYIDNPKPLGDALISYAHTSLGAALRQLGNVEEATVILKRALEIAKETYGPNHPSLAPALTALGGVLRERGDLNQAREALERALTIEKDAHGWHHRGVAFTLTALGPVLNDLGCPDEAVAVLGGAVGILEGLYGPEHLSLAPALSALGGVLSARGDVGGARAAIERAVTIEKAAFGDGDPRTALTLTQLAEVSTTMEEGTAVQDGVAAARAEPLADVEPEAPGG
jgi:tetratricopeptide (TPR) repeat protein